MNPIISKLKWGSTWKLLGLGVITYAVYLTHYARKQTLVINEFCPEDRKIGKAFIVALFVVTYLSLALLPVYILVPEGHPLEKVSEVVDRINMIFLLVWAFKARNRLNAILKAHHGSDLWFGGVPTFFLTELYINYKINVLSEKPLTVAPVG